MTVLAEMSPSEVFRVKFPALPVTAVTDAVERSTGCPSRWAAKASASSQPFIPFGKPG